MSMMKVVRAKRKNNYFILLFLSLIFIIISLFLLCFLSLSLSILLYRHHSVIFSIKSLSFLFFFLFLHLSVPIVNNFDTTRYDVKKIMESNNLLNNEQVICFFLHLFLFPFQLENGVDGLFDNFARLDL